MTRPADVSEVLAATFAGRRDAYNRWTGSQYVAVREALTAEVVVDAIRERRPVGGYFLAPGDESHVLALDFDCSDGWQLARRVGTTMWGDGLPAYAERSRDGRAHLWAVAQWPLPAVVLRHALHAILAGAGIVQAEGIELRPGSDRLHGAESLGHALRLPTMPHPRTGERHPLCDPRTGEPLGASLSAMMMCIEHVPAARLTAAAGRYRPPAPQHRPERRSAPGDGPIARFNAETGVSAVLARSWGVERASPGRTVRCPCHDDRNASLSIARDDTRAWCHSPGCELYADGRGRDAWDLATLADAKVAA